MIDQCAFDFHGANAMSGDVHYIVHPPEQPVVAVFVSFAAVAGEVFARKTAPVGLYETLGIAVNGAHHGRPWLGENQVTTAALWDRIPMLVDHRSEEHTSELQS